MRNTKKFLGRSIILNNYIFSLLQLLFIYIFIYIYSLVSIPVDIASSAVGLNICEITERIKKYQPIKKEKKKNM